MPLKVIWRVSFCFSEFSTWLFSFVVWQAAFYVLRPEGNTSSKSRRYFSQRCRAFPWWLHSLSSRSLESPAVKHDFCKQPAYTLSFDFLSARSHSSISGVRQETVPIRSRSFEGGRTVVRVLSRSTRRTRILCARERRGLYP